MTTLGNKIGPVLAQSISHFQSCGEDITTFTEKNCGKLTKKYLELNKTLVSSITICYWLAVGKLYINGDHLCRSAVLQGELPRQLNFFV